MRLRTTLLHLAMATVLAAGLAGVAIQFGAEHGTIATAVGSAIEPREGLSEVERATIRIFENASPSVVQVAVRAGLPNLFAQADNPALASGTGFIWDEAGHVVTNAHVIKGATLLVVRLASGDITEADLVGAAPNYDLAVIRIRNAKRLPPPLKRGTSADLKVGQAAFAIGNPFGLDQSLTSGIISALKRRLPTTGGREISNVIQTDAAINPGNSGGPLLDSAGRVIGVTTAIISPSGSNAGIGFAIPVDVVSRVVPQLIELGRVPTPGIGIVAGNEELATRLGVEGVVVVQVAPASPAARAGLRGVDFGAGTLGDVIVEANGKPVRRLPDLIDILEQLGVGQSVELTVTREGRRRTVSTEIIDIGRS